MKSIIAEAVLWITGIVASGVYGAFIGAEFKAPHDGTAILMGMIGTACAFVCARIWILQRQARRA